MDVIDRVPRCSVAGAHAKEKLRNMQIECQRYAYEHGVDKPEVDQWTWPDTNKNASEPEREFGFAFSTRSSQLSARSLSWAQLRRFF